MKNEQATSQQVMELFTNGAHEAAFEMFKKVPDCIPCDFETFYSAMLKQKERAEQNRRTEEASQNTLG